MATASPDGRVWAVRKNDPDNTKFRWPAHLVELDENLDYAPSEKRKRKTEPATTDKTVRVTEPQKEN
ncbi:MAG: hypothetical protein QJR09_08205 [Micrococcus sp.]|nr:hypothetical protein [Micrococcus sp.]